MSTSTRLIDVAFKAVTGALVGTTVVAGTWFTVTGVSAAMHYDNLAREAAARKLAQEEAARAEAERRAKRRRWW